MLPESKIHPEWFFHLTHDDSFPQENDFCTGPCSGPVQTTLLPHPKQRQGRGQIFAHIGLRVSLVSLGQGKAPHVFCLHLSEWRHRGMWHTEEWHAVTSSCTEGSLCVQTCCGGRNRSISCACESWRRRRKVCFLHRAGLYCAMWLVLLSPYHSAERAKAHNWAATLTSRPFWAESLPLSPLHSVYSSVCYR